MATIMPVAAAVPLQEVQALAKRGDRLYLIGCLVCGTWLLGPIGAAMLIYGLILMRRAELKGGVLIRPWTITLIGGFILVDCSVNMYAWGLDLLRTHDTVLGRSLWIDYGMMVDGAYMVGYNAGNMLGGVNDHGEKAIQIAMVTMSMPIKLAATWGFLKMKKWGLQWQIISYWMYFIVWMIYMPNLLAEFDLRHGMSDYGVIGFWLLVNIPFLGPIVLLPYLHTLRPDDWED